MPTGVDVFLPNPNKVILPTDMIEQEAANPLVDQIADMLDDLELSELAEKIALNIPIAIKSICYGCQGVDQNMGFGLSQTNHQFPSGLCLENAKNCVLHAMPEAMKMAGIEIPISDSRYSKLMETVLELYRTLNTTSISDPSYHAQPQDDLTLFTF